MHQRDLTYAKWIALVSGALLIFAAVTEYWPASGTSLNWLTLAEAGAEAERQEKPIFVDVYADWCGPCKQMERTVFPTDSVRDLLTGRFVLAKINGDDPVTGDSLKKQFGIRAYPTYIVLSPAGKERKRRVGFVNATNLVAWLADSAGVQILSWPELNRAVQTAQALRRRIMVLVLQSGEDMEHANTLFEGQKVAEAVGKFYVPTLLVRGNSGEESLLSRIAASPRTEMSEVIVLESNGKEVGRFFITPQMQYSSFALENKLIELAKQ
jgi:thiol-disulfide isomerase/thioredoxin